MGLQSPASANDHLGSALAAGDFNGDGFSDLVVKAPDYDIDSPGSNDGAVANYRRLRRWTRTIDGAEK